MSSRWGLWGATLFVAILVTGCVDRDPHPAPATKPASSTGRSNDEVAANADKQAASADRDVQTGPKCLQPPWVPGAEDDRVRRIACANEHAFGLVLPGSKPFTQEIGLQFLEQHRAAIHAVKGVESSAYGVCCKGAWPNPKAHCVAIGMRLCSTTASDVIDVLTALQKSSAATADVAFQVSIELIGLLGPRCEPDQAQACGPVPYRDSNENPPPAKRTLVDDPEQGPRCEHDGECIRSGCGNQCEHWTQSGGIGTCEGRSELEPAFCGCVEQQCSWFR